MIKINANNRQLAAHLVETAFAVLRNEGLGPVDCLAIAYEQLGDGIDISPGQKAALHEYLQQIVTAWMEHNNEHVTGATK